MTTPKPKLDLFNDSPYLVSKKCRTSTPSLRPPKPPTKSSKNISRQRGYLEHRQHYLDQPQAHLHPHFQASAAAVAAAQTTTTTTTTGTTTASNFHLQQPYYFHHLADNSISAASTTTTTRATSFKSSANLHDGSFSFGLNNNLNDTNMNITFDELYSRMDQQFEVISKIGSGYFADVYKVKSLEDGQYYAIKKTSIPFTSTSDRIRKLQEVRNHQSVPPHPNCVKYYDSWEEDGFLYIQTELCKTNLNEILESSEEHKLPEQIVWKYLLELLSAVKHLHDHDLLHLDIKPENIFIAFDGTAKLGDFGLMRNCSDLNSSIVSNISMTSILPPLPASTTATTTTTKTSLRTITDLFIDEEPCEDVEFDDTSFITPNHINHHQPTDHDDSGIINRSYESIDSIDEGDSKYLASETMQGKFTKAADIFCLGITMFEVASGLDLPQGGETYHKLRHNEIEDLYFNGLSADLVRVIKMMMEEDYTKRPTVDDLLQLDAVRARRLNT